MAKKRLSGFIFSIDLLGQFFMFGYCTGNCSDAPFLQGNCSLVFIDGERHAELRVSVNNACSDNESPFKQITTGPKTAKHPSPCVVLYHREGSFCTKGSHCRTCESSPQQYSVTWRIGRKRSQVWRLNGWLWNRQKTQDQVVVVDDEICRISMYEPETEKSTEQASRIAPSARSDTLVTSVNTKNDISTERIKTESHQTAPSASPNTLVTSVNTKTDMSTAGIKTKSHLTGASLGDVQTHVVILLGVTGCVVCVVIIMAVLLAVLLKRRGRPASELPPPPAPHTFRRDRLEDVVLFHARAPPPVPHGDTDSIDSLDSHLYCEIPDSTSDHHLASSSASLSSNSVSDSAWTDGCLRHIACPSSDSSESEEYLDLVDSVEEEEAPNVSGVLASTTASSNSCGI